MVPNSAPESGLSIPMLAVSGGFNGPRLILIAFWVERPWQFVILGLEHGLHLHGCKKSPLVLTCLVILQRMACDDSQYPLRI